MSYKPTSKMLRLALAFAILTVAHAGDVLVLTDSNFQSRLSAFDLALVKFYAPWCGHCKQLAPEFEKAATILKNNDPPVILAEVDCTGDGKDTCETFGVSGYPTLKAFKRGEKVFDYEGPRQSNGIVKYMQSKAGPNSRLLETVADAEKFLDNPENSVVGFFEEEGSLLNDQFQQLASSLSDNFRFAHTFSADVRDKFVHKNTAVIFQSPRLQTKLEPAQIEFTGQFELSYLKEWVEKNIHGLVGHRKTSNIDQFNSPLVVVYYDVDYVKNAKGTNYWRNRVIKVAKHFSEAGHDIRFAVSNSDDFQHELSEYGLTFGGEKPVVAGRNSKDEKFVMSEEFTPERLQTFVQQMLDDQLTPHVKSEPVPSSNDEPVKVVVGRTFKDIVNDPTKDVLIEFYAPWCGHCKSLAPKYEELATKLKDEDSLVIAKMDATANDVPKPYEVRGFPTLYFAPKGSKENPKSYEGGREVDEFIKYLARESTEPLKCYDRDGSKIKTDECDSKKKKTKPKIEL